MEIALYPHGKLPFPATESVQPSMMFDADMAKDCVHKAEGFSKEGTKAQDLPVWSVLVGLSMVDIPGLLAHTNVFFGFGPGSQVSLPKRFLVQITTMPAYRTDENIPRVITSSNQEPTVKLLWDGDNGSYAPFDLCSARSISQEQKSKPEFWELFFKLALYQKREEALREAEELSRVAQEIKRLYSDIRL